jgi:hypothetical protein
MEPQYLYLRWCSAPNYRSPRSFPLPTNCFSLPCTPVSHIHPMATSPSNFQLIMGDALDAYKGHTRKDLFAHPLAAQLQNCDSPREILLLLHQQIQALNQSRNTHQRLTGFLDPTVNVLYAFAMVVGEGVNPVCFKTCF